MNNDPIVEEVRRTRQRRLAEFGGDLARYVEYLQAQQKKHPERIITVAEMKARRAEAARSSAPVR